METESISGIVVSALGVAPFVGGGILNLMRSEISKKNIDHVGYSRDFIVPFGLATITLAALVLIPITSFLGVILATAWMGGAIAAHVRVRDKSSFVLAIIPITIWIGFGLRHKAAMHELLGF